MREKIADKKERVLKIIEIFNRVYSDADCTLEYDNPLQLLISTQLAAQCTDTRVNICLLYTSRLLPGHQNRRFGYTVISGSWDKCYRYCR